ncbi:MAG: methylated-DNA--[protein]-cysteine S-methyltransferase [Fibrobacterales bacterium]|nr:methylated-DNA--[protein]-cysteine S-methyltransferase [Fibrobacterales bacterium]MBP5188478.1 methylated-DNA--[protein]-cysteine S-methyltransferase [Fibrobacterales bacterium]
MVFGRLYATPEGLNDLWAVSDGEALVGLRFVSPAEAARLRGGGDVPVFREVERWLDCYFAGRDPGFVPACRFSGLSPFGAAVIRELFGVPFGETICYGELAERVARRTGGRPCARAVGQALGCNPICVIAPCHRVVGARGSLGGYSGGVGNKRALLALEAKAP